ncbi:MAG: amino acid permease, partial [Acidobacteriota bacterium]
RRTVGGGGGWETIGKVVLFVLLIVAGLWVLPQRPVEQTIDGLTPFFAAGALGLVQAMGYTFIALQGFDLIAAVGGEVRSPRRNLPRAMVISLLIALAIYIPLLLLIATVGVPEGTDVVALAIAAPEAVVALAVENYLGRVGFWLVLIVALLSMLSALQANLLAASHIALAMARDRNLPARWRRLDAVRGTPAAAVTATAVTVAVIVPMVPDVATAGAVSSLIFLLSFALAHWTSILARRRGGGRDDGLRLPLFPLVPVVGGLACIGLAIFQGVAVPAAGGLAALWLVLGAALYLSVFSRRARVADAAAEALDPQLVRLRGRAPLVLVPIARPSSAAGLVAVANALTPPLVGRVVLLSVVTPPKQWDPDQPPVQLAEAQKVLGRSLTASFAARLSPEALTTVAPEPWEEIARVAAVYQCESLLLGVGDFDAPTAGALEGLIDEVAADVVLLRAPDQWRLGEARTVLVPVGGRRDHSDLRARLIGSLCRTLPVEIVYLGVVSVDAPADEARRLEQDMQLLAEDEAGGQSSVEILRCSDVPARIAERAIAADLTVLGLQRSGRRSVFGTVAPAVARAASGAVIMISRGA